MKILHTSDWHLGRSLYGRKRYAEFSAFLDWLTDTIVQEQVDILLVAGDVFDTSTPGNFAQELYYRFLHRVSMTGCQHVVIIAGNHDSPSFLNAPRALLQVLNVYVVGAASDDPQDEVLLLHDQDGTPQAIICAVPYLREKDIRIVEAGESFEDKSIKLIEGLKAHYTRVCEIASEKQRGFEQQGYKNVPVIAMGHLFTAGGKTLDGDGVRELYVGSLAYVGQELFPDIIDYLALGHLHIPQCVGNNERFRYSGSPLAMSFGEAEQLKQVIIVSFEVGSSTIKEINVPCFQALKRIVGTLDELNIEIESLKQQHSNAWLEIEYRGKDVVPDLWSLMAESISGSKMEILRIKNKTPVVVAAIGEDETLDDMNEYDVFERCLQAYDVPEESREELILSYKEIIHFLQDEDRNAL